MRNGSVPFARAASFVAGQSTILPKGRPAVRDAAAGLPMPSITLDHVCPLWTARTLGTHRPVAVSGLDSAALAARVDRGPAPLQHDAASPQPGSRTFEPRPTVVLHYVVHETRPNSFLFLSSVSVPPSGRILQCAVTTRTESRRRRNASNHRGCRRDGSPSGSNRNVDVAGIEDE